MLPQQFLTESEFRQVILSVYVIFYSFLYSMILYHTFGSELSDFP